MRAALQDVPDGNGIDLRFYDADQIARWVNSYPGVASHLRALAGRPMSGWRPLENWSAPEQGQTRAYLMDDQPKVAFPELPSEPITVLTAIERMRTHLQRPGQAVRLIGVSGVGKTRLAQALFDPDVGERALNGAVAVYGDLSLSPATTATQVAEQLVQAGQRAILIVDNCPGETHRALVAITQRPGSDVSLLTVDFDVGVDQPDNTLVVRLHESSDQLIDALLKALKPHLSSLDLQRVVVFAGGNARIALQIAESAIHGESLANLSDRQIVDRLFLDGRRQMDDVARRCAEAASLVYAFHVEQEGTQPPEHPILAELVETTAGRMYRAIADFVERGIAQKRGTQRAILPQALAIRLAEQCLDRLPAAAILEQFNRKDRERLFKSFARRLGQLHESTAARNIAERLLHDEKMLGDPSLLNSYGFQLFENIAPAAPEAALAALERAAFGARANEFTAVNHGFRWRSARLARNLAFETKYFARAARVLLAMAKREPEGHRHEPIRDHFLELFSIALSFTMAPPDVRFAFVDDLLASADAEDRRLGVAALDRALTTGPRTSSMDLDFGSRPRGSEWRPTTYDEQSDWLRRALRRLATLAVQQDDLSVPARVAISNELRGLIRVGLLENVIEAVNTFRGMAFWPDAWKNLCMSMHFDRAAWSGETLAKITALEGKLRPTTLEERFVTFVINEPWGLYCPDPADPAAVERNMASEAMAIGKEAIVQDDLWPQLAERALSHVGQSNCLAFGRGLAEGANNLEVVWRRLTELFLTVPEPNRNPSLLHGFIQAASTIDPSQAHRWLDDALNDQALGAHIVALSLAMPVDGRSIERLARSLTLGRSAIDRYYLLAGGRATDGTPAEGLVAFLRALIAKAPEGAAIAADILHMHLYSYSAESGRPAPLSAVLDFGKELLSTPSLYQHTTQHGGYDLSAIARYVPRWAREPERVASRLRSNSP